jgi:hypothetical protein
MRKALLALLLLVLAVVPAMWQPARGQAQAPIQPQILYARQRQISIPFDPDPAEAHRLKQLQLYYSTDKGQTWHVGSSAAPEQRRFNFLAENDGYYLFAVQTTDLNGRNYPDRMDGVTPGLRVVIDTVAPIVNLRPLPPQGNQVGIAWDIRDDNLDLTRPDAVRLEYRIPGAANFVPLYPLRGATQHYWSPGTTGAVEVKFRATDLAGNFTDASAQVSLSNQNMTSPPGSIPGTPGSSFQGGAVNAPLDDGRRFINSKRVTLNYEITEKGPSGISGIDLWLTTNGRLWSKFQLPKNAVGDAAFNGPLTFDVDGEGVYGFTIIPRSGVGYSAPAPQIGEKPQIWIEVDLTKPFVQLENVMVGEGNYKGQLSISWTAKDKNLGPRPISLYYSPTTDGLWTAIEKGVQNTGRYVWTMPASGTMPWQFYLKVEAVDLANNVGEAITPGLVRVDTLRPKAKIVDVQPGK